MNNLFALAFAEESGALVEFDDKVDDAPHMECDYCHKIFKANDSIVWPCMHKFGRDCLQFKVGEQVLEND